MKRTLLFLSLGTILSLPITISTISGGGSHGNLGGTGNPAHKEELLDEVWKDMDAVCLHGREMPSKDFKAMARGNAALENDLKELYNLFTFSSQNTFDNYCEVRDKVEEFCGKWCIRTIKKMTVDV